MRSLIVTLKESVIKVNYVSSQVVMVYNTKSTNFNVYKKRVSKYNSLIFKAGIKVKSLLETVMFFLIIIFIKYVFVTVRDFNTVEEPSSTAKTPYYI